MNFLDLITNGIEDCRIDFHFNFSKRGDGNYGTVIHPETERSPSMGSGHFSSELNSKAASFKQIFAFDIHGGVIDPEPDAVTPFMDREDCYTVSSLYHSEHSDGSHFFYGGPGGCSEKQ